MGKVLRVVATIAIAVGIAVLAAPTGGLSLALAGALSVSATVASAVIATGLSLIAGLAMQAIAGKPSTAGSTSSPQTFRQSITNARILYGRRRAGGVIVFFHPRTVGKKFYRYFVVAITGHRCKGVVQFMLNDEVVSVDGSGKVTSGPYANAAWLWFERGDENAAANSTFTSECAPKWTTAHRGRGVSKLYAKFEMTDAVVGAGFPNMTVIVDGKDDIRDPRTGAAGFTRNAIAVFYDWLGMPREEGGFGAYADEMPDDAWLSAQANVCDEQVPLRAGGSEERYAFDSLIEVGSAPADIRQTFVTCCAGTYTYSGGRHLMRPGYWVPVTATLEEDDLAGPISVPLLADEGEIATEVSGTFIDPSTLYQPQPVPTRSVSSVDIRQADYDLPHVTSHPRGQRILEIMLRRANGELRVNWPMNVVGIGVAAMDTVQLATARYGLSNYSFSVDSWGLSQDFGVALSMKQEDPEFYDWSTSMELLPGEVPDIERAVPIGEPGRVAHQIILATQTVAYPVTSTATEINVAAFNAYIDDGTQVAFPAAQLTGLAAATPYVLLWSLTAQSYLVDDAVGTGILDPNNVIVRYVTTANADGTYPDTPTAPGGDGGSGYGGGNGCPTEDAMFLTANAAGNGPGAEIRAGDVVPGTIAWTRHDVTGEWGAFPVTAVAKMMSPIVRAEAEQLPQALPDVPVRALRTSPRHRIGWSPWTRMEEIGRPDGEAIVVRITVSSAATYVVNGVGSHNLKPIQQDDS